MGTAGCFWETRPPVDGRPGAGCRGAGAHRTVMVWNPPEWSEWAGEGRRAPDYCCRCSTILKAQVLLCPSFPAFQLPLHPRSLSILYPSLPVSSSSCLPVTWPPLSSVPQSPYSSAPCHPNSSASSSPFLHHQLSSVSPLPHLLCIPALLPKSQNAHFPSPQFPLPPPPLLQMTLFPGHRIGGADRTSVSEGRMGVYIHRQTPNMSFALLAGHE